MKTTEEHQDCGKPLPLVSEEAVVQNHEKVEEKILEDVDSDEDMLFEVEREEDDVEEEENADCKDAIRLWLGNGMGGILGMRIDDMRLTDNMAWEEVRQLEWAVVKVKEDLNEALLDEEYAWPEGVQLCRDWAMDFIDRWCADDKMVKQWTDMCDDARRMFEKNLAEELESVDLVGDNSGNINQ